MCGFGSGRQRGRRRRIAPQIAVQDGADTETGRASPLSGRAPIGYRQAMRSGTPLAYPILAAIFAVLACLAPSAASAHAGHPRIDPIHHGAQAASRHGDRHAFGMPATARPAALAPDGRREPPCPDAGACRCGGAWACCAAGLAADPAPAPPRPSSRATLRPTDAAGHAGTGPETPSEPPRTLA